MMTVWGGGLAAKLPKEIPQGEGGGGSARFENDDDFITWREGRSQKSANH